MHLTQRLAQTPPEAQFTTAINLGELLYGATKRRSERLHRLVREITLDALTMLPFDVAAAEVYGSLRSSLERDGRRLDEPDLRIACIAIGRGLSLVTGNLRHFARSSGVADREMAFVGRRSFVTFRSYR